MAGQDFEYFDGDKKLIGYIAKPEGLSGQVPAVIIVHAFEGRNDLAKQYAEKVASLGYVGFAVDMYGDAVVADTLDGCMELMTAVASDRKVLRQRIVCAFDVLKGLDFVAADKIAAMGFCFGGMTVLDLARSGADVKGVVSLHGGLKAPEGLASEKITAKVLVLHGYDDPQVPPELLPEFAKEMNDADVDWQIHFYSNTYHSFTDPDADKIGGPEMGRRYNKLTTDRAWRSCVDLFSEVL